VSSGGGDPGLLVEGMELWPLPWPPSMPLPWPPSLPASAAPTSASAVVARVGGAAVFPPAPAPSNRPFLPTRMLRTWFSRAMRYPTKAPAPLACNGKFPLKWAVLG
jgi:hypothetical protein